MVSVAQSLLLLAIAATVVEVTAAEAAACATQCITGCTTIKVPIEYVLNSHDRSFDMLM